MRQFREFKINFMNFRAQIWEKHILLMVELDGDSLKLLLKLKIPFTSTTELLFMDTIKKFA